jgi:hypothetical protein
MYRKTHQRTRAEYEPDKKTDGLGAKKRNGAEKMLARFEMNLLEKKKPLRRRSSRSNRREVLCFLPK